MKSRTRRTPGSRILRLSGWLIVLMLLAATAGSVHQHMAERRDAERFPAPGRLVDIGSHRLHLHCAGAGQPTVWLEAGLGNDVNHWRGLFEQLSARQRTCAYDRAGLGWSEAGPMPRSAARVVDEALRLIDASGESGPFLLVGHSNGGAYVRLLAAARPQQVVGLVLVDPSLTHPVRCPQLPGSMQAAYGALVALAPTGLARALLPTLFPLDRSALPPAAREAHAANRARVDALRALWSETQASCAMQATADAAGWVPGLPVEVLLSGRRPAHFDWVPAAAQSLATAAGAPMVEVAGSGHWIQLEAPQAVLDAVERVLDRARPAAPEGLPVSEASDL